MPSADRGAIWLADLGLAGKVRPCLVLSVPTNPQDRVLATVIPHTTSLHSTRFEVMVQAKFLQPNGVFDAQQVVTLPQAKLIRKLGDLAPNQLALVEQAVRHWLAL
jgi:mRNA interferase MazF